MSKPCTFCDIIKENDTTKITYQDDMLVTFNDIKPSSKFHLLIVPKEHITDAKVLIPEQKSLVERMYTLAKEQVEANGYKVENSRFGFHWPPFHTVAHLHLHAISPVEEMSFMGRMMFRENSYWFVSPEYVLQRLS